MTNKNTIWVSELFSLNPILIFVFVLPIKEKKTIQKYFYKIVEIFNYNGCFWTPKMNYFISNPLRNPETPISSHLEQIWSKNKNSTIIIGEVIVLGMYNFAWNNSWNWIVDWPFLPLRATPVFGSLYPRFLYKISYKKVYQIEARVICNSHFQNRWYFVIKIVLTYCENCSK